MKKVVFWLISRSPFYFLFFILPVLVMSTCEGWNAGNMETQKCVVDLWLVREYADLYYAFVMISSFMVLVPILFYIVIFIAVSELLGRALLNKIRIKQDGI